MGQEHRKKQEGAHFLGCCPPCCQQTLGGGQALISEKTDNIPRTGAQSQRAQASCGQSRPRDLEFGLRAGDRGQRGWVHGDAFAYLTGGTGLTGTVPSHFASFFLSLLKGFIYLF